MCLTETEKVFRHYFANKVLILYWTFKYWVCKACKWYFESPLEVNYLFKAIYRLTLITLCVSLYWSKITTELLFLSDKAGELRLSCASF